MVRITVDEQLKQKLSTSGELVEICDESGRIVGRFVPEKENSLEGWVSVMPELTEEEIQRRLNSDEPGLTTEQVKEYLRNRR